MKEDVHRVHHWAHFCGISTKTISVILPQTMVYSMYADDHQLYVAKDSPKEVEKVINDSMDKVCSWYKITLYMVTKKNIRP